MKLNSFMMVLSIILLIACKKKQEFYEITGETHTPFRIVFQSDKPSKINKLVQKEIKDYYNSLNPFDSHSIISRINRNEDIVVDSIFINAFNKAKTVSELTNGMMDITCAPLINLWGFGFSNMNNISPKMIDSLKSFIGYQKIKMYENKVLKEDPRILLNFSAVGDGCICDLIANLFEKYKIENYLIEFGGEISAKGINKKGNPWIVAITRPSNNNRFDQNELIETKLQISQRMGIATSGDYRNFYIKDGKKYAHTLNPKTGYPAAQNILSATVLAKECLIADGFATAIMSMGTKGLSKLEKRIPNLNYFIIYSDSLGNYKTKFSKGMEKYFC